MISPTRLYNISVQFIAQRPARAVRCWSMSPSADLTEQVSMAADKWIARGNAMPTVAYVFKCPAYWDITFEKEQA